jgi:excisionase family DNA binding protein
MSDPAEVSILPVARKTRDVLLNSTQLNAAAKAALPNLKKTRAHRPLAFTVRPSAWRVNDALLQLGISRATLYKMAGNGEIRLARIGGRTLVPDSEIARLVGGVSRSA